VRYDLLRSPTPADFVGPATCLEWDEIDTGGEDPEVPGAGQLAGYLVRVENDCPGMPGSLGSASDGTPRLGASCP
jgi:hypothetical protein